MIELTKFIIFHEGGAVIECCQVGELNFGERIRIHNLQPRHRKLYQCDNNHAPQLTPMDMPPLVSEKGGPLTVSNVGRSASQFNESCVV